MYKNIHTISDPIYNETGGFGGTVGQILFPQQYQVFEKILCPTCPTFVPLSDLPAPCLSDTCTSAKSDGKLRRNNQLRRLSILESLAHQRQHTGRGVRHYTDGSQLRSLRQAAQALLHRSASSSGQRGQANDGDHPIPYEGEGHQGY